MSAILAALIPTVVKAVLSNPLEHGVVYYIQGVNGMNQPRQLVCAVLADLPSCDAVLRGVA